MNADTSNPHVLGYVQTLFFVIGVIASMGAILWLSVEGMNLLSRFWKHLYTRKRHKEKRR